FPSSIWEKFFAVRAIRFFLPLCDKIIAQSTGMKNDLIRYFNINPSKITTIYNPAINISELENAFTEVETNNFLYVGRLQAQKGLPGLLHIIARVTEEFPDITLTIVGDGPEMEKLVSLSGELNITSSVFFKGYQPKPLPFFQKAKATVLTS